MVYSKREKNASRAPASVIGRVPPRGGLSLSPSEGERDGERGPSITVSNHLFLTPDLAWRQPIREETFARFHDWAEQYVKAASDADRAALERAGVELAAQRRSELSALIRTDPERALELAVPLSIREALPRTVTGLLETRISDRGDLAVLAALPEPGKESEVVPTWRTASIGGTEYKAFVYGRRLGEPTRNNIPLNGIAVDKLLAVNENPVRVLEPEEASAAKARLPKTLCPISGLSSTVNNQEVVVDAGGQTLCLCCPSHVEKLNKRLVAAESGPPGSSGSVSAADQVAASTWTEGVKNLILIRVDFSD